MNNIKICADCKYCKPSHFDEKNDDYIFICSANSKQSILGTSLEIDIPKHCILSASTPTFTIE